MIERLAHAGWPNCYRLWNDRLELVVTSDVGPRIVWLGFIGGDNIFGGLAEELGMMGGPEWHVYFGHRFWHSPEAKPRSYYPDNHPIRVDSDGENTLCLIQPPEPTSGMQKTLSVTLARDNVEVVHTLTNEGLWPVEASPWALSVMATESTALIPQPQGDPEALLPNRTLTLWPYTDMTDARVRWGRRFVILRQDPTITQPIKLGMNAEDGWCACITGEILFLKCFDHFADALYPDHGCSVESYANDRFLELETLGPMDYLEPGDSATHVERWHLFENVHCDLSNEGDIVAQITPLLAQAGRRALLRPQPAIS